jgi:hypothetical protein
MEWAWEGIRHLNDWHKQRGDAIEDGTGVNMKATAILSQLVACKLVKYCVITSNKKV